MSEPSLSDTMNPYWCCWLKNFSNPVPNLNSIGAVVESEVRSDEDAVTIPMLEVVTALNFAICSWL
jgi:hypothetical protein